MSAGEQIYKLATYILELDCGYPKEGGAGDCAIQMIKDYRARIAKLENEIKPLRKLKRSLRCELERGIGKP